MTGRRGSPPVETRFKEGRSGNPKGRPRKVRPVASAFDIIMDKSLTIIRNGREREISIEEALQQRTYQDAIAGSRSARREVLKMVVQREKALSERRPTARPMGFKMEHSDPDNGDDALRLLGIASPNPRFAVEGKPNKHLLLEPWAVELALRRRRTSQLEPKDIAEIERSTRAADSIRWPRGVRPDRRFS